MTLYEKIKTSSYIIGAHEAWSEYREGLTGFLVSLLTEYPQVLIVGAGECNDIDLGMLIDNGHGITLLDYDTEAMEKALFQYHLSDDNRVKTITGSVTGTEQKAEQEFVDRMEEELRQIKAAGLQPREFDDFVCELLTQTFKEKKDSLSELKKEYDAVIAIGLFSQLQAGYAYPIEMIYASLGMDFEGSSALNVLKKQNQNCIPKINDLLLQKAKGILIAGNEWKRCENGQAVEGAYQAICDLKNRAGEYSKYQEYSVLWPFDEQRQKSYELLLQTIER